MEKLSTNLSAHGGISRAPAAAVAERLYMIATDIDRGGGLLVGEAMHRAPCGRARTCKRAFSWLTLLLLLLLDLQWMTLPISIQESIFENDELKEHLLLAQLRKDILGDVKGCGADITPHYVVADGTRPAHHDGLIIEADVIVLYAYTRPMVHIDAHIAVGDCAACKAHSAERLLSKVGKKPRALVYLPYGAGRFPR